MKNQGRQNLEKPGIFTTCVPDLENTWNFKIRPKTRKKPGIVEFDIPGFSRSDFRIILCNINIRKKKFSRLWRSYFYNLHITSNVCRLDGANKS